LDLFKSGSQFKEDAAARGLRLRVSAQLLKNLDVLSTYASEEIVMTPVRFGEGSPEEVGVSRVTLFGVDKDSVQVGETEKGGPVRIAATFAAALEVFAQTDRHTWRYLRDGSRVLVPLQFEDMASAEITIDLEAPHGDSEFEQLKPKAIYVKHVDPLKPLPSPDRGLPLGLDYLIESSDVEISIRYRSGEVTRSDDPRQVLPVEVLFDVVLDDKLEYPGRLVSRSRDAMFTPDPEAHVAVSNWPTGHGLGTDMSPTLPSNLRELILETASKYLVRSGASISLGKVVHAVHTAKVKRTASGLQFVGWAEDGATRAVSQ